MAKTTLTIKVDNVKHLKEATKALTNTSVFVGVPDSTAARDDGEISNASLAYIHENGSPIKNIPARPFLRPGIENVQEQISARLKAAGVAALSGSVAGVMDYFNAIGLLAQAAVKRKIVDGPFAPLAPATLRARQRKGRVQDKPLIDTGRLLGSISYVVKRGK